MSEPDSERHRCEKCHAVPTPEDFLKYHFKLSLTPIAATLAYGDMKVADDDGEEVGQEECAICPEPYGSENLVVMKHDVPYQVTGRSDRRHTFGHACVEQLIRTFDGGLIPCPLCRVPWCYTFGDYKRDDEPESFYAYLVEREMRLYCNDYTIMYDLF